MMRPQIGEMVYISEKHHGFAKGRAGKIWGYTPEGRAIVKIDGGFRARVRPQNLVPLLDVCGKEAGGLENRGN